MEKAINIYLSGKITGSQLAATESVAQKFQKYEDQFTRIGFTVFNPVKFHDQSVPKEWHEYMKIDLGILLNSNIEFVVALPDWKESKGATLEIFVSSLVGIKVIDHLWMPIHQPEINKAFVEANIDMNTWSLIPR